MVRADDGSRVGIPSICGMYVGRIHRCGDHYKIGAGFKFEANRLKTADFAALRVSMVGSVSGTTVKELPFCSSVFDAAQGKH